MRYLASGAQIVDEGIQVSEVSLGNPDDLKPGTGKNFAFGSEPALVIKSKDGELSAFIATCSHLGCTVALDAAADVIAALATAVRTIPKPARMSAVRLRDRSRSFSAIVDGGKLVVRKGGA